MTPENKWPAVVVSDLDGTLLNHEDYSFREALPAIDQLKQRGIPVVLVSSKTRAEMEVLREELGLEHPFIVENGGAAYLPSRYFEGGNEVIEWGVPYRDLVSELRAVREETGVRFQGYSDVDVDEVALLTGLGRAEARRSKERQFDEPFWFEGDEIREHRNVLGRLEARGLTVTRGGRFYHIMGNCDKGRAVHEILELYRNEGELCPAAGLGDAKNDAPFLQVVDRPYIVAGPGGQHDAELVAAVQNAFKAGPAPRGWAEAISHFLSWLDGEARVAGT
jgi:mannosyl-3-phosphoglycerate phosphatase